MGWPQVTWPTLSERGWQWATAWYERGVRGSLGRLSRLDWLAPGAVVGLILAIEFVSPLEFIDDRPYCSGGYAGRVGSRFGTLPIEWLARQTIWPALLLGFTLIRYGRLVRSPTPRW